MKFFAFRTMKLETTLFDAPVRILRDEDVLGAVREIASQPVSPLEFDRSIHPFRRRGSVAILKAVRMFETA